MGALSDIRDILRGALASLGGFGGRMIARFILMISAGHLYGAAPLGLLGQVAAITEILAAIAILGLKRRLLDFLSESSEEGPASIIKGALLVSLGLGALLTLVLYGAWPFIFPGTPMPVLLLAAVPALVIAEVGGAAIRHQRIIRFEVLARCVMEPWAFLAAALGFYYSGLTATGLIAAYAVSAIAAAGGILLGMQKAFGLLSLFGAPVSMRALWHMFRKTLPTGITDIGVMMFRRVDILILSLVAGHSATGVYYMAQQIVTIPHKIHQLFEPMMIPVLASLHHGKKRAVIAAKLAGFCRWTFTLQLALTIPFAVFGAELLGLFGDQFTVGALILAALLVAELLDGSFALTETALVFARPTIPPQLIVGTLVVEAAAVAGFAAFWGPEGAALGFLLAMGSLAVARLVMLRRHLDIRILNGAYLPPIGIGLLVGASLFWLKTEAETYLGSMFGLPLLISVGVFLLLARLVALTPSDKALFKQLRTGQS